MRSLKRPNCLVGLVLAVSLGVTYLQWHHAQQDVRQELHSEFDFHAQATIEHLEQRMSAYEQVLLGVRAFFDSSESVSREEFNRYVSSLHLNERYPGLQGVSYSPVVSDNLKAQHIASIRQQGFPEYTIHPPGERDIYTPVVYIEPFTGRNVQVLGYDTSVESVRRSALDQARDSGRATLSGKLKLMQETEEQAQAGFLMFLPLYAKGALYDTLEDRRANFIGVVTAVFRMGDLMAGLGDERSAELDLEIFDGEAISALTMMYDSDNIPSNLDTDDSRLKILQQIEVADHSWTLAILSSPDFEARIDNTIPMLVASSGSVFSILLALLLNAYLRSKNISRELQESEERWRFALEGAGDGVWDWNLQTNEVHFSRQWKAMLGHTEDEVENNFAEWKERVHPDDLQKALDDVEAHVSNKTSTYVNEHRMRHKDGSWVWILDRGMVIRYTKDGKPLRMIGTHADITDQKKAVEKLYESERYNRMLFEQSSIGLVLCRMNGELVDINPAYARIIGRTIEETLQLTYWDITPESYAADERFHLASLNNTGRFGPYEKEHIHKDGYLVPVRLNGILLEQGGETFIWSSVEDITENKRMMQILRSLAVSSISIQDFENFLHEALANLTEFYGCKYAFVGQLLPDGKHVRTLAVCAGGKRAENFEYDLKGTPCQDVLNVKAELILCDAQKQYPEDKLLVDMGVDSYYGSPLRSADNKMMGVISVMDIEPMNIDRLTEPLLNIFALRIALELERQNSEQALRDSEQRFRQLTENINEVFWLGTPDWHEVLYVSPAYEKTWGMSAQNLYDNARTWIDTVHPDDREQVIADIPRTPTEIGSIVDFREYRIIKPDGQILWIKARVYPIRDDDGKVIRVAGIAEDVTQRKQVEDKLKQQHDFNDTVLETAGNVIVILDTSGCIVKFNRAAEALTGYRREELIGQPIWDWVIPEEQMAGVKNVFDQLMHGNTDIAGHHVNDWLTRDGSRRNLDWLNTILRNEDGAPTHVVALGYDITERLRAENELKQLNTTLEERVIKRTRELEVARDRANAANEAKSNFLSNMSHEIRSPLAAIIGFSESLMTDDFSEQEHKKITSTIVRNGRHLLQVINDILDISKIEADQLEVELIDTSIFLLLGEVDSLLGMNARDKGLEFKITYHFPLPDHIVTDPTCLKQILFNLCSNAIKFTNVGRIEVEVSCNSDFRQMQVVVSDSGIGMTAEEALRVFDPFAQADSSITRKYGGTGLGLSISRNLAKALNGDLSCESRKGEGSRFTLTFDNQNADDVVVVNRLEDVSIHYDEQSEQVEIKPLAGHILLVEDSPDNQQLISMFIRKTGAQLTLAENGKQALEKALTSEFDLILMDMQMPVMDGLEAIRQLRTRGYKRPIVSLTANALLSDREKCVAAGADNFLIKPIDLHKFYGVLNHYLPEDKMKAGSKENQDLQKAMLDSPQYKAMVERFLTKLPQMIEELSGALAGENWDECQAKSHDLKGMGGAMGYPMITEQAGLINTLVRQKNYDQLADAGAELEKTCRSIIQERGTKNV